MSEMKVSQEKNRELEHLLEQEQAQNSTLESRLVETSAKLKSHEETISLLVSEKASLTSALDRLDEAEISVCFASKHILKCSFNLRSSERGGGVQSGEGEVCEP